MIYQLSQYQYETLQRIANSDSVTFTIFGLDKELDELIALGLLQDASAAFQCQLSRLRSTAGDTGRVLMITSEGLKLFWDQDKELIN